MITEKIFILRTFKHSESDLIVHGLNSKGAKLHMFARSALKSRKRFGGGTLEPTQYVQVTYGPSRSGDGLASLSEASVVKDFAGLRTSFDRLELALYFVKVIDQVSFEGLLDSDGIFHLLGNSLAAAETTENLDKLRVHFHLKLLGFQGVLPKAQDFENLFGLPIKDHERIQIAEPAWKDLKREIQRSLEELL